MAKPHYVRDSIAHLKQIVGSMPRRQAMEVAVGGDFDLIGEREADILIAAGLREGDTIVDAGCGSGRAAKQLGRRFQRLDYLGIDVVPDLLAHAASVSPPDFRFQRAPGLAIPKPDASTDMVCFFSVFTHLLHEESYRYLRDARRALKPGGKVVFSFLEAAKNWEVFAGMVEADPSGQRPLNMFVERPMIAEWARHLDLAIEGFDVGPPLGQSVVVLRT